MSDIPMLVPPIYHSIVYNVSWRAERDKVATSIASKASVSSVSSPEANGPDAFIYLRTAAA